MIEVDDVAPLLEEVSSFARGRVATEAARPEHPMSPQTVSALTDEALALGKAEGLQTIGMGVEDAADLSVLSELGCEAVQGYICSAPLPATGLIPWISQWEKR